MNLLPYNEFSVFVPLPQWEVCRRLLENVSEKTFWSDIFRGNSKFQGDVQETYFKIYRNIGYRNSGLPILHGLLEETEGGTKIIVKMKLHKFVQLFFFFWVFTSISFVVKGVDNYMTGLIMIIAATAIIYLGFWFEVGKSKSMFIEIFEKEIGAANQALRP